jgi:hypothetical protein
MATIAADPIQAGYRGFASFAELIDEPLEQHERRIARAHFGASARCTRRASTAGR